MVDNVLPLSIRIKDIFTELKFKVTEVLFKVSQRECLKTFHFIEIVKCSLWKFYVKQKMEIQDQNVVVDDKYVY